MNEQEKNVNSETLEARIEAVWKRFIRFDNIYRETGKCESERNAARDEWRQLNGLPRWEWRLE